MTAFPFETSLAKADGLTKREYFAGLAMQGMMSSKYHGEFLGKGLSRIAVKMADELLKELNK